MIKKKFLCECLNGQMNIVLLLVFNLAKPILKVCNQYFNMSIVMIRCQWWWWSNWSDVNNDDDDVIDQMSMMMMKLIRWYSWGVLIHNAVFFHLLKVQKQLWLILFFKILIELLKLLKGTVKEMQQKRSISKWKQVIWT